MTNGCPRVGAPLTTADTETESVWKLMTSRREVLITTYLFHLSPNIIRNILVIFLSISLFIFFEVKGSTVIYYSLTVVPVHLWAARVWVVAHDTVSATADYLQGSR